MCNCYFNNMHLKRPEVRLKAFNKEQKQRAEQKNTWIEIKDLLSSFLLVSECMLNKALIKPRCPKITAVRKCM